MCHPYIDAYWLQDYSHSNNIIIGQPLKGLPSHAPGVVGNRLTFFFHFLLMHAHISCLHKLEK